LDSYEKNDMDKYEVEKEIQKHFTFLYEEGLKKRYFI
jgi:hypothetical protein